MRTTPPLPREVQLEVTGACNLACRMCLVRYRPRLGRAEGSMDFETFRNVVDALPGLERLTLQGLGEPLLCPDLDRMIAYAAAHGVDVGFNTNGTLLSPARSRALIESDLAWLHISLDGATPETFEFVREGARFKRVERNVRALVDARRQAASDRPLIQLVAVAMRRNLMELPDLVGLAHDWGVGRLWVQNLSHSFSDTQPEGAYGGIREFTRAQALWLGREPLAELVFERMRELASELGVVLRLPELRPEPAPARAAGEPGCAWPWTSAYITHDGVVQPCCMVMGSDRAALGRLDAHALGEIWHGEAYRAFREALLGADPPDVCKGCSMYRGVF